MGERGFAIGEGAFGVGEVGARSGEFVGSLGERGGALGEFAAGAGQVGGFAGEGFAGEIQVARVVAGDAVHAGDLAVGGVEFRDEILNDGVAGLGFVLGGGEAGAEIGDPGVKGAVELGDVVDLLLKDEFDAGEDRDGVGLVGFLLEHAIVEIEDDELGFDQLFAQEADERLIVRRGRRDCGGRGFRRHAGDVVVGRRVRDAILAAAPVCVGRLGEVDGGFGDTVDEVVGEFDALHEAVVLVADLVFPGAETPAAEDAEFFERGQDGAEDVVAFERRRRIAVVRAIGPGGDDFAAVADELCVEATLDRVLEQARVIDRLGGRLAGFGHERPMRADIGDVVGAVVGKQRRAIERAVGLGEIHPAFRSQRLGRLAAEAEADDVGRGVFQARGGVGERRVGGAEHARRDIERERVDERVVAEFGTVGAANDALLCVDFGYGGIEAETVAPDEVGDAAPDGAGAAVLGELEGVVRPPGEIVEIEEDVLGDAAEIGDGDAFADPVMGHLLRRVGPDLEIVGEHEHLGEAGPEAGEDPLAEIGGTGGGRGIGGDDTLEAAPHCFLGEVTDVVLDGIRNEAALHPSPGFALMGEPALGAEGALHELVEVTVVGKLDVSADVPGKALFVGETRGETARVVGLLENQEIGYAEFLETVGGAEAGGAGAEDDETVRRHRIRRRGRGWRISRGARGR